jgi:hypothetical protein
MSFTLQVSRLKRKEDTTICYYSEPGPDELEVRVANGHQNTRLVRPGEVPYQSVSNNNDREDSDAFDIHEKHLNSESWSSFELATLQIPAHGPFVPR